MRCAIGLGTWGLVVAIAAGCGGGDEASGGAGGSAGSGGSGASGGVPNEVAGCDTTTLLEKPDYDQLGPWPVGARTVTVDGLTTEVWYPAELGSGAGDGKLYDLRDWLPESEKDKIPDQDNPYQPCDCYDGLPLDAARGPYPVVIFVHGTAGFRTQSLELMVHWASRGFVVLAADHPTLYLADMLSLNTIGRDLAGDLAKLHAGISAQSAELEFLKGSVDASRMALAGHSAGGGAIADQGDLPGVRVLMPLAARGVEAGSSLESTLVMGALEDGVANYQGQVDGYVASPAPKRLVGISNTGHLFPSSLCWLTNSSGEDMVEVATKYQIQNAQFASILFDCPDGMLSQEVTHAIVAYSTAATLEETLHCDAGSPFDGIEQRFTDIGEFREEP